MRQENSHVSDHDLLQAADGELPARQVAKIRKHLTGCWTCRARMAELERVIASYMHVHRHRPDSSLPPADGARALLKAQMRQLAAEPAVSRFYGSRRLLAAACSVLILAGLGAVVLLSPRPPAGPSRSIPDPRLTPGATLPVTRADVCSDGTTEAVRLVPASVALQVFASYGIHEPQPGAYELDYLITPALGGADNIRNFWPQPYGNTIWNAHVKDALEDHLHRLVCEGEIDLTTAQRDISRDWIAAYKKYFRTGTPLSQHASFIKDRPWE